MKNLYLLVLVFFISFYSKGQDRVWKKQVSRIIDTREMGLSRKSMAANSTIFRMVGDAIKAGKIHALTPYPFDFLRKMTDKETSDLFERTNTFSITDPVTNDTKILTTKTVLDYSQITIIKIFEESVFDPATGKMTMQIKYIGPMCEVYGNDHEYRGRQTIFWISYADFSRIIEQQHANHLVQAFNRCLWQSYFNPGSKTNTNAGFDKKTGLWHGTATGYIEYSERNDTATALVENENADTVLSLRIENRIMNSKIPAWPGNDTRFRSQLTKAAFIKLCIPEWNDTITVIDPVTNDEKIVVIQKDLMRYVNRYSTLEDWVFNPATGKMEIGITGIAPILMTVNYKNETTKIKLWIRYADLQPILNSIEQYHPANTFAMHIWNSFFLSDAKPILVK